ncbi:MAG: amidohydrolase family protein [Gammaproteobacteria bacterium]|nr:amidohydrolase family protein [Gammaproteobacteria bacterium]
MRYEYDLIIRGGTIVDGTGGELFDADLAVRDGNIARIGQISGAGEREIDARDRLVMPGFVDIHTHYDAQATWANHLTPSSSNGVTTVLMGNCGVGFAPVRPHDHERLISLMEGVEDIPEVVLSEGLSWAWESFPEYLHALSTRHFDVDVAAQVPHAPLRVYVMGERGANREPATAKDIAAMAALAREGVQAGAFGFSTSRLLQHRTAHGEPVPSYGAAAEELQAIALAVSEAGRHCWIQLVADYAEAQASEFELYRLLTKSSGLPLTLSLLQRESHPDEWRQLLDRIELANEQGLRITGQTRGRPTSTLMGFELSFNPFDECVSWQQIADLSFDDRLPVLQDPEFRARIISESPTTSRYAVRRRHWERIFRLGNPPNYEPTLSESVACQAEQRGMTPEAVAYEWMMEQGGRGILYRPTTNYAAGSMDAVYDMLRHPHTLIGLGDGGAHVGVMCDATDMTHALTHWTRDRSRGGRLEIADVVRRLTSANAAALGLSDRGILRQGLRADINVVNYDELKLHAPAIHYDLPAGGKRLLQRVDGYDATLVAGQAVWTDGDATGALPGRLLRSRSRAGK